jgi:hypothetical protein
MQRDKNTGARTGPKTGTHRHTSKGTVISNPETSTESKGRQTQTHIGKPTHKQRSINKDKLRRAIHLYVCKAFVNKLLAAMVTGTVTRGLLLSDVARKHLRAADLARATTPFQTLSGSVFGLVRNLLRSHSLRSAVPRNERSRSVPKLMKNQIKVGKAYKWTCA